jgi:hypothetical protein
MRRNVYGGSQSRPGAAAGLQHSKHEQMATTSFKNFSASTPYRAFLSNLGRKRAAFFCARLSLPIKAWSANDSNIVQAFFGDGHY